MKNLVGIVIFIWVVISFLFTLFGLCTIWNFIIGIVGIFLYIYLT